MPILPITDGRGHLLPDAFFRLLAVMRFPERDAAEVAPLLTAAEAAKRLPPDAPVLTLAGTLKSLQSKTDLETPAGALIALAILSINLHCAEHHPELIGYRRAGSILRRASASTIKRAWWKFAPVSPLWVAYGFPRPRDPWQEWVRHHVAYSEAIRLRAEVIYPHGQQTSKAGKPLLDPEATWKAPPDLGLPEVEATFPPLSADQLRELRRAGR